MAEERDIRLWLGKLGVPYNVKNYGVSARTLMTKGDLSLYKRTCMARC